MIYQLGPVQFDAGKNSPIRLAKERSLKIAVMERIQNKDTIQKMGESLQTITLDFELHWQLVNVRESYAALLDVYLTGQEVDFIDGTGYNYGQYLIIRMSEEVLQTDARGLPIRMTFTVSLLEFAPETAESEKDLAARKDAFASIKANPIEVKQKPLVVSAPAIVSRDIQYTATTAKAASSAVKKATDTPALAKKYIMQGQQSLDSARKHVANAKAGVATVQNIITNATNLADSLDSVETTLNLLNQNFNLNSLSSISVLSGILDQNISTLMVSSTQLNSIVATRL